MNDKLGRMRN